MNAQTVHCQSCGAAASSESPVCEHCGARLAAICCPSCLGMTFLGSKYCPHCGSPATDWRSGETEALCPACQTPMLEGTVGKNRLRQCDKCFGIWLDTPTFEQICRHADRQSLSSPAVRLGQPYVTDLQPVRYRRCPECQNLMNRVNFAQCSGVVVDVCSRHGTWFDQNELQQIVAFIRAGGLDRARERKKMELETETRRLEMMRAAPNEVFPVKHANDPTLLSEVVRAVGHLLWSAE